MERLLLDRTDGLSPHALAAFIDGWGSLLKVLDRSDLVFPAPVGGSDAAAEEARQVLRAGVQRIREAQALILDDDPEDLDAPL